MSGVTRHRELSAHLCHVPSCPVAVPRKMLMCLRHWYQVPKPLRDEVWKHYKRGQESGKAAVTKEYIEAAENAVEAVRAKERDDNDATL